MKRTLALFLALLMALFLCACGGGDTPLTKEELLENAETIYLNRLEEDFQNNIIAAKDKYVGKPVIVPGYVYEITEEGCILYYSNSVLSHSYLVKANIPVDELKNLNAEDIIHVVGIIADGVETDERIANGRTFIRNYITMENAYFVDKITELSGIVRAAGEDRYINTPFLTGDSDRIRLFFDVNNSSLYTYDSDRRAFETALPEGATVTIPAVDVDQDHSSGSYSIICTRDKLNNIKIKQAGE